jgi:regulator of RNase E activity RraA
LRLYQNKKGDYVVYDKNGKVVIITHHKSHALEYARSIEDAE